MSIIEVNHVTREYQLNQWRRLTGQPVQERVPFKALDDASFSVKQGAVVGIIGTNGASKTGNWCLTLFLVRNQP